VIATIIGYYIRQYMDRQKKEAATISKIDEEIRALANGG
jgi:hypothetical protein